MIYADGALRGNPGPAAIGAIIFDDKNRERHRISETIGRATNNQAEYRAAIAGLEAALALGAVCPGNHMAAQHEADTAHHALLTDAIKMGESISQAACQFFIISHETVHILTNSTN